MHSVRSLQARKSSAKPIRMLTCYDHWSARILDQTDLDMVLVGDSVAMVVHGYADTLPADVEMMCVHTSAVRRGAPKKFIVTDLPFLTFQEQTTELVRAVKKIMLAGANAVKVEGATRELEKIRLLVDAGVPVMGHLGLTPQKHNQLGGFGVQAKADEEQDCLLSEALQLQDAGCFALVLECVPSRLAERVSRQLKIPVLGIGAGDQTDGQVLVLQDLLGANSKFKPKFVRKYENLESTILAAVSEYCEDVESRAFPSAPEVYL